MTERSSQGGCNSTRVNLKSFSHQSLPPTNLGRVDEEMVPPVPCLNRGGGDRCFRHLVPSWNFAELIRNVTCMVLSANTSIPCHDKFRGARSDYVRQTTLGTTTTCHVNNLRPPIEYEASSIIHQDEHWMNPNSNQMSLYIAAKSSPSGHYLLQISKLNSVAQQPMGANAYYFHLIFHDLGH
ncbi:hypothetical protein TNCV_4044581 [Trichonephila clavipes]|nr:hypothetical protein TNCV_4044581 [Trichonephila clavipes]